MSNQRVTFGTLHRWSRRALVVNIEAHPPIYVTLFSVSDGPAVPYLELYGATYGLTLIDRLVPVAYSESAVSSLQVGPRARDVSFYPCLRRTWELVPSSKPCSVLQARMRRREDVGPLFPDVFVSFSGYTQPPPR